MDFFRNNRLEIKMMVSHKTACYIIGAVDLISTLVLFSLQGVELAKGLKGPKGGGMEDVDIGLVASFMVAGIVNLGLALLLLRGTKQRKYKSCQIYIIAWIPLFFAYVSLVILLILRSTPAKKDLSFYFQVTLYPLLLLLYKPFSLFLVRKMLLDLIREGRGNRRRDSSFIRKQADAEDAAYYGDGQRLGVPANNKPSLGLVNNNSSHNLTLSTFQINNRGGDGDFERIRGVDDLLHQIEFPMDSQVSSEMFQIGEAMLKVEHDYFVKKGFLLLSKGSFSYPSNNNQGHSTTNNAQQERVEVAIKIFRQNVDVDAVRRMLLETKILTMLRNHNNVIKMLAFCTENIHKGKMMMLLEYCERGTLEDFLKANGTKFVNLIKNDRFTMPKVATAKVEAEDDNEDDEGIYQNIAIATPSDVKCYENVHGTSGSSEEEFPFNSKTLLNWALQLANGMEFINGSGIIHGSLMAKYCIVDDRNRLKISNFTFATQLYQYRMTEGTAIDFSKIQLPWRWMAIENMKTDPPSEASFTDRSDVWSYGVVLWEMFSLGGIPYEGEATNQFFQKLLEGERLPKPTYANSEVFGLMKNCWVEVPGRRTSFDRLKSAFLDILQTLM